MFLFITYVECGTMRFLQKMPSQITLVYTFVSRDVLFLKTIGLHYVNSEQWSSKTFYEQFFFLYSHTKKGYVVSPITRRQLVVSNSHILQHSSPYRRNRKMNFFFQKQSPSVYEYMYAFIKRKLSIVSPAKKPTFLTEDFVCNRNAENVHT